jgi:hypothetical protein
MGAQYRNGIRVVAEETINADEEAAA